MLMSKYLAETFLTCFLFINKESDHYCSNCYSNNHILNYSRPVMLKRCLTATFGKNVWYMPSAQVLDDTFNRIYSICEDQRKPVTVTGFTVPECKAPDHSTQS